MKILVSKRGLARALKRNRLAPSIRNIEPAALLLRPDGSTVPLYSIYITKSKLPK
jgi:hypothetical protein